MYGDNLSNEAFVRLGSKMHLGSNISVLVLFVLGKKEVVVSAGRVEERAARAKLLLLDVYLLCIMGVWGNKTMIQGEKNVRKCKAEGCLGHVWLANLVFFTPHLLLLTAEAPSCKSQEATLSVGLSAEGMRSEWLLLTPLDTPEVECLEALLIVEKPL